MERKLALAAAAAALFLTQAPAVADEASEAKIRCEGVNACKGASQCHTANNACAGLNECKGKGMLEMTRGECEAAEGRIVEE